MIDKFYEIRRNTILTVGEFTINWNLFEKYYCHNDANETKIIGINLNPFTEMRSHMNVFREELIKHFQRHCWDYSDEGLQTVLFTRTHPLM